MEVLFLIFAAILGLIFGSFLNAAGFRLFNSISISKGRSKCVHCNYILAWYDLVPVGSFVLLKGSCRACKKPIPLEYLFVELIMAMLFTFATWMWIQHFGFAFDLHSTLSLFRDLFVVTVFVFLFVYDAKYYLVPDLVTIPAIVVVFVLNLFLGQALVNLVIGGLLGGGFFAAQYYLSRGKWVGGGDIRFGALMGVLLSWPVIIVGVFSSYIIGSVIAVGLLAFGRKQWSSKLPFVTFLSIGGLLALWWGQDLIDWYLTFL